jgi:redox-sensitive bicupin YhaK (pirin superfamily)
MIQIRKGNERGRAQHGWLESYHTFSFADYYDPTFMGFRALRVINEDRVQPGAGFPSHSHRDMEILSYVLEGALEHKDSLGNGSVIRPGEVQRMTAGRGITHSEFNPSRSELVRFLQIWIMPEQPGISPSYEQQAIDLSAARGKFHPIASREGGPGKVKLHQDATMSVAILEPGEKLLYRLASGRRAWLQVARGAIALNDYALTAGDGAAIDAECELTLEANRTAEILTFDLA